MLFRSDMRIGIEVQRLFRKRKHGMEVFALHLLRGLQELISDDEYVVFVRDGEDAGCLRESENLRIVRSVKYDMDQTLLAALNGWEFRAATRDGASIAVEFLLSIPAKGL